MRIHITYLLAVGLCVFTASSAWSAIPINLRHQSPSIFLSFSSKNPGSSLETVSQATDFNHTQHIRLKQTYYGHPVWGGDVIVHTQNQNNTKVNFSSMNAKKTRMNGLFYQDLAADLGPAPSESLIEKQKEKALADAVHFYQSRSRSPVSSIHPKTKLIAYVDEQHKAHWAYYIEFIAKGDSFAQPVFIMDAITGTVYKSWNNLHTVGSEQTTELSRVSGGGYGGNRKIGLITYEGIKSLAPQFAIARDTQTGICYLRGSLTFYLGDVELDTSDNFVVNDGSNIDATLNLSATTPDSYSCVEKDPKHVGVYWNNSFDFMPDNDVFYHANLANFMFIDWYKVPIFMNPGTPDEEGASEQLPVQIYTHERLAPNNAFWIGELKSFFIGDGDEDEFAPFASLDIVAHELGHAYTEQHANLVYEGQSGGLNESFSDMTGVAAGYYQTGESNWKIGKDITLIAEALRYMDSPRHDCVGKPPYILVGGVKARNCSIDHVKDYQDGYIETPMFKIPLTDVHFSSGIFNKVFYLMSQGFGGDKQQGTRKAFNVMVQANQGYWTSTTSFQDAACGVVDATHDYGYDESVVSKAFSAVGIDTGKC